MIGKIELILGHAKAKPYVCSWDALHLKCPMYSGKSTELIKIANRYKSIKKNVLAINHILNNRYNSDNISTHDKNILESCIITDNLLYLLDTSYYKIADVIIIEELQFFNDAYNFVTYEADIDGKSIICAELNGV